MDSLISQLNTAIDTKHNSLSSKSRHGLELLYSQAQLSKLISGSSISSARIFSPGQ